MTTSPLGIDPITLSRLRQFGRRRWRLILVRGLCAGIVALLCAFTTIGLIDWLLLLPEGVRWAMSIAGYSAVVATAWLTCLRLMLRIPSQRDLARLVEVVQPGLREDLLSAVELGSAGPGHDSPVFRALLQESVAQRMRGLDVSSLLPARDVGRWMALAMGVLALCAGLALVPNLPLGRLWARAVLPMANIARISDVRVTILQPTPHGRIVPTGDPVAVLVEVSRPEVRRATLETHHPSRGRERTLLTHRGEGLFGGDIAMADQPIEYRILAGDAVTEWHTLRPHAPPYVTGFSKTYRYPEYTGLSPATRRENEGAIVALQGTRVDLEIETDQPSAGELLIEDDAGGAHALPLKATSPTRLAVTVPVDASRAYQVRLVATGTQLANKHNPRYEIKAEPDQPPKVELTRPRQSITVQPEEIVPLAGAAEDDWGLARVEQWIQVNGAEQWMKVPLTADVGRQTPIARAWDLIQLELEPGDLVTTKLVAIDRKGSMGESAPLQVAVSFREINGERLAALQAKRSALAALAQLVDSADAQVKEITTAVNSAEKNGVSATAADVREKSAQLTAEAAMVFYQVNQVLQRVPKGSDVHELTQVGRIVAAVLHEQIDSANRRLALAAAGEKLPNGLNTARGEMDRVRAMLKGAEERYRATVAAETVAVALNDLHILARERTRLVRDDQPLPADPMALRRLARVLVLVSEQLVQVEKLLIEFDKSFGEAQSTALHQLAGDLARGRAEADVLLAALLAEEKGAGSAEAALGPWRILGPLAFPTDYRSAFEMAFEPEQKVHLARGFGGHKWVEQAGWVDGKVHVLADQRQTVHYLYRTIHTPADREITAFFSSNEGIKAFLNREVALEALPYRYIKPDMDKRKLQLKAGQNNLLIKIVSSRLEPAFCFRADGASVPDPLDRLRSPGEKLFAASGALKKTIAQSAADISPIYAELLERLAKARQELASSADPVHLRPERLEAARSRSFKRTRNGAELHADQAADLLRRQWPVTAGAMRDFATIGEVRPDADSRFVADTGDAARALRRLLERAQGAGNDPARFVAASEPLGALATAYRTLEVVHNVVEIGNVTAELAAQERWAAQSARAMTYSPAQWGFAAQRMAAVAQQIESAKLPAEAAVLLRQIPARPHGKELAAELGARAGRGIVPTALPAAAEQVNADVVRVLQLLQPAAEQAREALRQVAPDLPEMLRMAAERANELHAKAGEAAGAEKAATPERAAQLREEQQRLDQLVRNAVDALRQDANVQDPLVKASRERARDDDDAIALVRRPASRADAMFARAAAAEEEARRRQHLRDGAEQAKALAEELEKVAGHFEKLREGKETAESRRELRQAEAELEIKEDLDKRFGQLDRLGRLAELARIGEPERLLKELEKELATNDGMRKELERMAKNAARQALRDLEDAADQERRIGGQLAEAAVAAGEMKRELDDEARELQKRIAELAERDVPAARAAAAREKVEMAAKPLADAQKEVARAVSARPGDAEARRAAHLAEQAAALREAAAGLAEAAIAADRQDVAEEAERAKVEDAATKLQRLQREIERLAFSELPDAALSAERASAKEAAEPIAQAQKDAERAARDPATVDQPAAQREARLAGQAELLEASAERLKMAAAAAAKHAAAQAEEARANCKPMEERVQADRQLARENDAAMERLEQAHREAEAKAKGAPKDRDLARQRDDLWYKFKASRIAADAANRRLQASEDALARPTRHADEAAAQAKAGGEKAAALAQAARALAAEAREVVAATTRPARPEVAGAATTRPAELAAAAQARLAGQKAAELADVAQRLSEQLARAAAGRADAKPALADAAREQAAVAEQVRKASEQADRAAEHEQRLGNAARAKSLAGVAKSTEQVAAADVPAAAEKARSTPLAKEGKAAIDEAKTAIDAQARALEQLVNPNAAEAAPQAAAADEAGPMTAEEREIATQLARALDLVAREAATPANKAAAAAKAGAGSGQSDQASGSEKTDGAAAAAKAGAGSGKSDQASGSEKTDGAAAAAKAGAGSGQSDQASGSEKTDGAATAAKAGAGSGKSDQASGSEKTAGAAAAAKAGAGSGKSEQASGSEKTDGAATAAKVGAGSGQSEQASGSEKTAASAADAAKSGSGSGKSDQASGSEKNAAGAAAAAKSGSGSGMSDQASGSEKTAASAAAAAKSGSGSGKSDQASGSEKSAASAADAAKSGSGSGKSDQASGAAEGAAAAAKSGGGGSGSSGASGAAAGAADASKSGGGKGGSSGASSSLVGSDVASAVQAAAAARAGAMAAMRNAQPKEAPGGPTVNDPTLVVGLIDPEHSRRSRAWGELKIKEAQDVAAGDGETVAEPYRSSVDAYFRALNRKARESKP